MIRIECFIAAVQLPICVYFKVGSNFAISFLFVIVCRL